MAASAEGAGRVAPDAPVGPAARVYAFRDGPEAGPGFDGPTDQEKADLEAELADWFFHAKRGRHAKVWMYRRPGEYWFLVRHGLASKRQEVVSATGADTLIFRPGEYDVLVYNRKRGELRVHGCNPREVEILRSLFGKHIFHDKDFFPGGARFTLAPLVDAGRNCLACSDIPGIEHIILTEAQVLVAGGSEWLRSTHQAADLFTAVEHERVVLPEPDLYCPGQFPGAVQRLEEAANHQNHGQQQAERGAGWRHGADGEMAGCARVHHQTRAAMSRNPKGFWRALDRLAGGAVMAEWTRRTRRRAGAGAAAFAAVAPAWPPRTLA